MSQLRQFVDAFGVFLAKITRYVKKAEIRNPTQDTILIRMARGVNTSIQSIFIIAGDGVSSSLHLEVMELELPPKEVYKDSIKREESYLVKKYLEVIERKFIEKLRKK